MGWSPFVETTVFSEPPESTLCGVKFLAQHWFKSLKLYNYQFHNFNTVSLQMFPLLTKTKRRSRSKLSIWLTYTRNHKSCQEQQAGHMVWSGNYSHRNSLSDGISCLNCKFIKQRDRAIDKTATKNSWDVKPNWRWKRKKNTNKVWGKFKILGS